MTVSHSTRYAIPKPNGDDPVINGDNVIRSIVDAIDGLMVTAIAGPVASRPAPGILGRIFLPDDVANRVYFDTATAWIAFGTNVPGAAPIGTLADWAGAGDPDDASWLHADGRSLLRTDYPELFLVLGGIASPFGIPDSTHFRLPNISGRVTVGADANHGIGATGGARTVTLTAFESGLRDHDHATAEAPHRHRMNTTDASFLTPGSVNARIPVYGAANTWTDTPSGTWTGDGIGTLLEPEATGLAVLASGNLNAAEDHENEAPWMGLNKIIRAL